MQSFSPNIVWRLVLMQLGLTLLLAMAMLLPGRIYAISTLAGGVAATAANGAAALLVFRRYKASETAVLMRRFYLAELARLVLTITFFLAVILWLKPLSIVAMLGAYLLIHLSTGSLMLIVNKK
ncbi:MAG: ATP synthase subunit I [Gammaproteobacteria bacterium]|nr:ATP synthase subunit I [Gammaproteobacteria bacterium]